MEYRQISSVASHPMGGSEEAHQDDEASPSDESTIKMEDGADVSKVESTEPNSAHAGPMDGGIEQPLLSPTPREGRSALGSL